MNEPPFHFLAEHSHDLICVVGPDHVMTYVARSCTALLGWDPEQMVGRRPDSFIHPQDLPTAAEAYRETGEPSEHRTPTMLRMRRKTGDYIWMEVDTLRLSDPGAAGDQLVLIMRDVTARLEGGSHSRFPMSRRKPDHSDTNARLRAARGTIFDIDLYLTASGHIAFLESAREDEQGRLVCSGYVLNERNGKAGVRVLEWLASGDCLTTRDDLDRIKRRI